MIIFHISIDRAKVAEVQYAILIQERFSDMEIKVWQCVTGCNNLSAPLEIYSLRHAIILNMDHT